MFLQKNDFSMNSEDITRFVDMLEAHFGNTCEIVLHDLRRPYDQTIVDIRNGHITNRKIGDCGSNLGLAVMRGESNNGDQYNYITYTRDGKILRSSSAYFRDIDGNLIFCICINENITESVHYENYLHARNRYIEPEDKNNEVFGNNVGELLDHFITQALSKMGKTLPLKTKEEKLEFLKYLDMHGAFLINKSGEQVCDVLKISKYTFYNYLDTIRNENKN